MASVILDEDVERAIRRLRVKTVQSLVEKQDGKALADVLKKIRKSHGNEALAPIKQMYDRVAVDCVSTGYQELDDILSGKWAKIEGRRRLVVGSGKGVPRGRIVEIFGPESSGKTTLCQALVAAYQARGLRVAYVDAEHAVHFEYADNMGCNTDTWYYTQPNSAEEALDIVEKLVESGVIDLIIVDSVAAMTPQKELDGEVGDPQMGLHARLMSQACRKISSRLTHGHRCTVVFVNQTRSKIGVMFGNPETTTGGNALKFYASVRLRISSMGENKGAARDIGIRSKVKVVKNKIAMPYGIVFLDIDGGNGITAVHSSDPRKAERFVKEDDSEEG